MTYWTSSSEIDGEAGFTYSATGNLLNAVNAQFTTITAIGNVQFDGGTFTFNESGNDHDARFEGSGDPNLLVLNAAEDGVGIGVDPADAKLQVLHSSASEYALKVQQDGNYGALLIEQYGDGDALIINNDAGGASNSIAIDHGAAAGDEAIHVVNNAAEIALLVNQAGVIGNTTVDSDDGGAIHVYNSANTGSAISAYSNVASATAPLAWLRVLTNFDAQPILRLEAAGSGDRPAAFRCPRSRPSTPTSAS